MVKSLIDDVPSPVETKLKVLAFDQGGIYIGVDYDATVKFFETLGVTNADALYSQANQTPIIDEFERGKISKAVFYDYLRNNLKGLSEDKTDDQLYQAWNAMLTGVIPGVLEFINGLRHLGYITIVVSNADIIHHAGVEQQLEEAGVKTLFASDAFDERYISYQVGYNKPSVDLFHEVFRELQMTFSTMNISPEEILFVDDSKKHIYGRNEHEGAINAGWQGLLVPSNSPVQVFAQCLKDNLKQFIKANS